MSYNTPHWKIIALICCARRSPKVTLITVFVSIVVWKQARWPPFFITFLISPCLVTSTYQVSSEIYGGIFYWGITLIMTSADQRYIAAELSRWSGDVMKRPGHKNFNAVSHNRSRPEVLYLNLKFRSWGQISSVLLQLLLFAFGNRKFGRHGKWSVTFWQWENNT